MFEHPAIALQQKKDIVFAAFSKDLFYFRDRISKYVLEQGAVPINPFMNFDYYLGDTVDRNLVRAANNNLVRIADALWVFAPISDGVLAEVRYAKELKKDIRYFEIQDGRFVPSIADVVPMDAGLEQYREFL